MTIHHSLRYVFEAHDALIVKYWFALIKGIVFMTSQIMTGHYVASSFYPWPLSPGRRGEAQGILGRHNLVHGSACAPDRVTYDSMEYRILMTSR